MIKSSGDRNTNGQEVTLFNSVRDGIYGGGFLAAYHGEGGGGLRLEH